MPRRLQPGDVQKSASFRGNLVKCASFRYKQWNVLFCGAIKRIVLVFDGNQWDVVNLRRNQADRTNLGRETMEGSSLRASFRKGRLDIFSTKNQ